MDLVLPVKGVYFDQIKAGEKTEEYRRVCTHWTRRFLTPNYRNVIITRGYPKRGDAEKRLVFKWNGVTTRNINHPHFGPHDVFVYVIDLSI